MCKEVCVFFFFFKKETLSEEEKVSIAFMEMGLFLFPSKGAVLSILNHLHYDLVDICSVIGGHYRLPKDCLSSFLVKTICGNPVSNDIPKGFAIFVFGLCPKFIPFLAQFPCLDVKLVWLFIVFIAIVLGVIVID